MFTAPLFPCLTLMYKNKNKHTHPPQRYSHHFEELHNFVLWVSHFSLSLFSSLLALHLQHRLLFCFLFFSAGLILWGFVISVFFFFFWLVLLVKAKWFSLSFLLLFSGGGLCRVFLADTTWKLLSLFRNLWQSLRFSFWGVGVEVKFVTLRSRWGWYAETTAMSKLGM